MTDPMLAYRIGALAALFRQIADSRMAGSPMANAALRVEAVGFELCPPEPDLPAAAGGVLVTPWCMSLVRLPLAREDNPGRVGVTRRLALGCEQFDFSGAHEAAIGTFDTCPLFSSMSDFASHETAIATAQAVLARLRASVPEVARAPTELPARPARRGFLFGRRGTP